MKKILSIGLMFMMMFVFISCDQEQTHEVRFVLNNDFEDVLVEVEDGTSVDAINLPTGSNHLLFGWYTSDDYEQTFDFNQEIDEDVTIYARLSHFPYGEENFIAFEENDMYGFMLPTGQVVIEAQYDQVSSFRYGYALVIKDGQLIFIDELGNESESLDQKTSLVGYNNIMNFTSQGYVLIHSSGETQLIDSNGQVLFTKDNIYKTEDINGSFIVLGSYFEDGLVPARVDYIDSQRMDECVYLDEDGNIALQGGFFECSSFSNGIGAVKIQTGDFGSDSFYYGYTFIDSTGDVLLRSDLTSLYRMYDGVQPVLFKDGYAIGLIGTNLGSEETPKYVVIDEDGQIIIEFEVSLEDYNLEIPVDVSDGYLLTKNKDDYYAIYSLDGDLIMDYTYQAGSNQMDVIGIFDKRVVLKDDNNQFGAVDVETGQVVIDFEYDYMSAFKGGYAVVEKDGLFGMIDKDGNVIVELEYTDMFSSTRLYIDQEDMR